MRTSACVVIDYVENRTFDEIQIGDAARPVRTLSKDDISLFAVISGDVSPTHVDVEYARRGERALS